MYSTSLQMVQAQTDNTFDSELIEAEYLFRVTTLPLSLAKQALVLISFNIRPQVILLGNCNGYRSNVFVCIPGMPFLRAYGCSNALHTQSSSTLRVVNTTGVNADIDLTLIAQDCG